MLPLIPIAQGLISIAPSIAKWFGGDKAEDAAQSVVDIARSVTGQNEPGKAVKLVLADEKHKLAFMSLLETQRNELDKIYLADRQDAREMYGKHNAQADKIAESVMKYNAFLAILIGLAQIFALSYFTGLPEIVILAIGNVSGYLIKGFLDERTTVCGFYFGSSLGSKNKK